MSETAAASRHPPEGAATALGFTAVLLWSTLATLTSLKGGGVPPFQTTAITFAVGGVFLLAVAALRGRLRLIAPTRASFALGVVGLFVYHALYFASLKLAPAAEASLITSLWALFTVLLSGLLPGHRLLLRHVVAALLGLVAAVVLVWDRLGAGSGPPTALLGYGLALLCALVWAGYSVLSRLVAAVSSDSLVPACLATSGLALLCSLTFEGWQPPSAVSWLALALLGLGPVGAAFLLWDIGMKRGDVARLGVLAYASPVLSTGLLVSTGLAEPRFELALACALMIAASWLTMRRG